MGKKFKTETNLKKITQLKLPKYKKTKLRKWNEPNIKYTSIDMVIGSDKYCVTDFCKHTRSLQFKTLSKPAWVQLLKDSPTSETKHGPPSAP